ncbi:hypothetical protein H2201_003256 [Coniosporium apollinis]|uniref:Defect at low temperature protein 1 n=1 Tax=Coniosporium apollinis TaxID=61459 RepID=A0ABQ9NWV7_9PEZI|nr:hypothetical protein H2201_003256 [Coniosporium apollinis]
MHMRMRIPFFRIWYSSTYTVFFVILLFLLTATPADIIYQSIRSRNPQLYNIFIVAGVHLLTAVLAIFIYASRIYTNRTVLAGIPKSYIPVEPGEVGKNVRRMIAKQLERSALIAWDARPRDQRGELQSNDGNGTTAPSQQQQPGHRAHAPTAKSHTHPLDPATVIPISPRAPPWGPIAHPGWSSPSSPDWPDVHFWTILPELPHLIEARAVALAPPDPAFAFGDLGIGIAGLGGQEAAAPAVPVPDARVVAALQRPPTMGLREYLGRLAGLGLVDEVLGARFLKLYEYARFSTQPLTEGEFGELLGLHSEILNGMTGLDPAIVKAIIQQDEEGNAADEIETAAVFDVMPIPALSDSPALSSDADTESILRYQTPRPDRIPSSSPSYYASPVSSRRLRRSNTTGTVQTRAPSAGAVTTTRQTPSESEAEEDEASLSSVRRRTPTAARSASPSEASFVSGQSVVRHSPPPSPLSPWGFGFQGG